MRIPCRDFTLEAVGAVDPGAPVVVICHPHPAFGGHLDNPLCLALDEGARAAGLAALRFNFRGVGSSGGRPTGGHAEHEDLQAVLGHARALGATGIAVVGYSFGGLIALRAAALGEPLQAAVSVALPTTVVGDHPERLAGVAGALRSGVPWLFLSGDRDPLSELPRLRRYCDGHPSARLEVLSGEGHFFQGDGRRAVVARAIEFIGTGLGSRPPNSLPRAAQEGAHRR